MAETTLDAVRGARRVTVTRSEETPRLGDAVAQLVIDNAATKLDIIASVEAISINLGNLWLNTTNLAGAAFADGAVFSDKATFSDQSTI